MLIKTADDKSKRVALLEDLQKSSMLDAFQRDWLRNELIRLKRGIQGERDAAHYLDNYLRDDSQRAVLHDLRISVDGEVAQIDHLVMTRGMHVYLLETKNFGGSLHINAHGEFSVEYAHERVFGIESPLEQSRRHEGPILKLCAQLEIGRRHGAAPKVHHCVLVHPKATIHRPDARQLDTSMVIKADQFRAWHEKFVERIGVADALGTMLNLRSAETLKTFAEKLARQHRPADLLTLPDFMEPSRQAPVASTAVRPAVTRPALTEAESSARGHAPEDSPPDRKRLNCAACGAKISYAEGKFCWNNARRFGGLQYCREHQAAFSRPAA